MFLRQVRGIIAVCVILAMVSLFLFLTSLTPAARVPAFSTGDDGSPVVELLEAGDASGIYYVRPETTVSQWLSHIGINTQLQQDRKIKNGAAFSVTREGKVVTRQMKAATRLALGLPLDVNVAEKEELMLIPGIGPKLAARIFLYREKNGALEDIDRLLEVKGIGRKSLSRLKMYLYVDE